MRHGVVPHGQKEEEHLILCVAELMLNQDTCQEHLQLLFRSL